MSDYIIRYFNSTAGVIVDRCLKPKELGELATNYTGSPNSFSGDELDGFSWLISQFDKDIYSKKNAPIIERHEQLLSEMVNFLFKSCILNKGDANKEREKFELNRRVEQLVNELGTAIKICEKFENKDGMVSVPAGDIIHRHFLTADEHKLSAKFKLTAMVLKTQLEEFRALGNKLLDNSIKVSDVVNAVLQELHKDEIVNACKGNLAVESQYSQAMANVAVSEQYDTTSMLGMHNVKNIEIPIIAGITIGLTGLASHFLGSSNSELVNHNLKFSKLKLTIYGLLITSLQRTIKSSSSSNNKVCKYTLEELDYLEQEIQKILGAHRNLPKLQTRILRGETASKKAYLDKQINITQGELNSELFNLADESTDDDGIITDGTINDGSIESKPSSEAISSILKESSELGTLKEQDKKLVEWFSKQISQVQLKLQQITNGILHPNYPPIIFGVGYTIPMEALNPINPSREIIELREKIVGELQASFECEEKLAKAIFYKILKFCGFEDSYDTSSAEGSLRRVYKSLYTDILNFELSSSVSKLSFATEYLEANHPDTFKRLSEVGTEKDFIYVTHSLLRRSKKANVLEIIGIIVVGLNCNNIFSTDDKEKILQELLVDASNKNYGAIKHINLPSGKHVEKATFTMPRYMLKNSTFMSTIMGLGGGVRDFSTRILFYPVKYPAYWGVGALNDSMSAFFNTHTYNTCCNLFTRSIGYFKNKLIRGTGKSINHAISDDANYYTSYERYIKKDGKTLPQVFHDLATYKQDSQKSQEIYRDLLLGYAKSHSGKNLDKIIHGSYFEYQQFVREIDFEKDEPLTSLLVAMLIANQDPDSSRAQEKITWLENRIENSSKDQNSKLYGALASRSVNSKLTSELFAYGVSGVIFGLLVAALFFPAILALPPVLMGVVKITMMGGATQIRFLGTNKKLIERATNALFPTGRKKAVTEQLLIKPILKSDIYKSVPDLSVQNKNLFSYIVKNVSLADDKEQKLQKMCYQITRLKFLDRDDAKDQLLELIDNAVQGNDEFWNQHFGYSEALDYRLKFLAYLALMLRDAQLLKVVHHHKFNTTGDYVSFSISTAFAIAVPSNLPFSWSTNDMIPAFFYDAFGASTTVIYDKTHEEKNRDYQRTHAYQEIQELIKNKLITLIKADITMKDSFINFINESISSNNKVLSQHQPEKLFSLLQMVFQMGCDAYGLSDRLFSYQDRQRRQLKRILLSFS